MHRLKGRTSAFGRGRSPRTPTPVRAPAQRHTAVVAADLTPAQQVAFDQAAEALQLPNAEKRASEAVRGVRELLPGLRVPFEDHAAYGCSAGRRRDPPQAGPEASRADLGTTPNHG